jgi:4-amino-4-deoxy-L-arabinose transferase-like glycosyltransferase
VAAQLLGGPPEPGKGEPGTITLRPHAARLMLWRSPVDQPGWARPLLLMVAAVAGAAYAWQIKNDALEPYYAAAVRSMSISWRNFVYAALDPAGTITVDKLPGAFWLQAISVHLFGAHVWAIVLPQVIEGVLAVLVLYRVVRRLAGPGAGLVAAAVLAVTPATVALNRGNISESLMTLLLLLAADATVSAILTGRTRMLMLAGLWMGLAFQTKSIEAWLVLPALGFAYLLAAHAPLQRRVLQLAAAVPLTAAVSLSWITIVTLTPAHSRPYVDGSFHNSVFEQVFIYNGFGRVGGFSPLQLLASQGFNYGLPPPPAWNRLLTGGYGHDIGWLIPAALISLVVGLVTRRREPRTDPIRASFVLWGAWLVLLLVTFSAMTTSWAYYTAELAPATAALVAIGLTCAWSARHSGRTVQVVLAVAVLSSVSYAAWLLPDVGTGLPTWLRPLLVTAGVATEVLVVLSMVSDRAHLVLAGLASSAAAVLVVPAVASASIVVNQLGPFDTPFQPEATTIAIRDMLVTTPATVRSSLPRVQSVRNGAPILLAAQPGVIAAEFMLGSGDEVLPIGGFTGAMPEPTLQELQSRILKGEFHLVITGRSPDPRYAWISTHCLALSPGRAPEVYYCQPSDVDSP